MGMHTQSHAAQHSLRRHPFAATGGRIVAQLAKQLAQRKAESGRPVRGLISICAAGGQGVTAILEA